MKTGTMQNDAPLYTALREYVNKGRSSFHTPGHKGQCEWLALDQAFDLTELPETDSLFECDGAIRQAELRTAELFGAADTVISAGGCTLAIQGMLAAFAGAGSKVIFARNIHRSAVNTAMLLGIDPVWVLHRQDCGEGLPGRVYPEDVRAALGENPDAAAVYLTSPDYYGCLSDIAGIAAVCREFSVPLLLDNAHGTHLVAFGRHPLRLGATASACSAHKTLPVLTGGAWLNCADARVAPKLKSAMALFGSTSPSYLTMASLDLARAWMQAEGAERFRALAGTVSRLRDSARRVGFGLPEGECDPVRLTLLTPPVGWTGDGAAERFRAMGVECEHSDGAAVVMILTPFNSEKDIARLARAIGEFPVKEPLSLRVEQPSLPEKALPPRAALERPIVRIPVARSEGRVAAEAACPCPPGVPVVMPGEIIDAQCVKILLTTGIREINVIQ